MRTFFLSLLCIFLCISGVKSQKLSPEAKISILTCAPGEEPYSLFGHSAIRVQDPASNMDLVFNYGVFDFNTPYFYFKYTQARLDYLLAINRYESFILSYQREKRSVYSQELLLDSLQKQQLFEALLLNSQPENNAYRYESFTDNCATRVDNIIKNTIQGNWENHYNEKNKLVNTYRTSYSPYLANRDWINLGLNIILGAPMEQSIKGLFLPDILKENYVQTTLNGKPIVGETKVLYDAQFNYSKTSFWFSPVFIFYLLAFLLLLASIFIPQKLRIIDFILFLALGVIGCLILFLWFATDHTTTSGNWNILWALPTHFIMAFVILFQHKKSKFTHYYFLVTLIIACILLIFMVFPQLFSIFNYAPLAFPFEMVIPILLCIIFRSLGIVRKKS